jgi:hypothetical protein
MLKMNKTAVFRSKIVMESFILNVINRIWTDEFGRFRILRHYVSTIRVPMIQSIGHQEPLQNGKL